MYFKKLDKDDQSKLLDWWRWLDENRGDRAQLRRAKGSDDILLTAAFSHFLYKMPGRWSESDQISITNAAMVAAVVARIKKNNEKSSFARELGLPKEGGSHAVMSELRFLQLQKSRTPDEFFTRTCRAIALLGGKASVLSVADDILHWLDEQRFGPSSKPQDRLAVRWASDYYAALKN
ncbi:MAG: type I-E CRISPR-associated protein Cse2/CasB [Pseudomonadales bacterium]|nr:type I-E CRISPR-associated protein Cse2/CasB [Pseudomonadales bacterium]